MSPQHLVNKGGGESFRNSSRSCYQCRRDSDRPSYLPPRLNCSKKHKTMAQIIRAHVSNCVEALRGSKMSIKPPRHRVDPTGNLFIGQIIPSIPTPIWPSDRSESSMRRMRCNLIDDNRKQPLSVWNILCHDFSDCINEFIFKPNKGTGLGETRRTE
jgi:hypothetical protein